MRSYWQSFLRFLPALGILLPTVFYLSCDSTARIFIREVKFDRIQVVSATPVKQASDGRWVPACNEKPEAVRVAFNLKSSSRNDSDGESQDIDLQIRPGEDMINKQLVNIGSTISAGNFEVNMACIEPHNGSNAPSSGCSGQPNPSVGEVDSGALDWQDNLNGGGRGTKMGLALVIDQSGSIDGVVDHSVLNGEASCLEGKDGGFTAATGTTKCESDVGDLRLAAAKNFITLMNDQDNIIVFSQNEKGVQVVCDVPGVENESNEYLRENCYNSDRRLTMGQVDAQGTLLHKSAIDALNGDSGGRSKVWESVENIWGYMAKKNERVRHIVVIADGPDTCTPSSDNYQHCFDQKYAGISTKGPQLQDGCSDRTFGEVRTTITDYLAAKQSNGQLNDMHVSFIHFQSQGYPQMDPRMQEIACLTGGHYLFLNFNHLGESTGDRKTQILEAVNKLRYTLSGHWGLVMKMDAYTNPTFAKTPVGSVYQLAGQFTMDVRKFVNEQVIETFIVGDPDTTKPSIGDNRLPLRKRCLADEECAGFDAANECGVRCSTETGLCSAPAHGASCSAGTGVCCGGACNVGEQLCADAGIPGSCP